MKPVKKFPMLYVYIGVAVGGFVFLVIIFCLICLYRRKKRQQYKSNERYEMKISNMESKVAKECRKGLKHVLCVLYILCKVEHNKKRETFPFTSLTFTGHLGAVYMRKGSEAILFCFRFPGGFRTKGVNT